MVINEEATFTQVVKLVPVRNIEKRLKIDLILENPCYNALYEKLKDLLFSQVKKIYLNKDSLIDDKKDDTDDENKKGSKRDDLVKPLFKIQRLIHLYDEKQINEFIRKAEFVIDSIAKKREIKAIIDTIKGMSECTIEEVINFAD